MKFNFKKIGSILASGIMLASTIGVAAAASYPEPFVASGTADSAVIVGANAATTDWAAAIDVQTKLNALVSTTSGSSASGGDSYKFEKSSTKWHLGVGLLDVVAVDITEDYMPTLLADGKYIDDDNDEFDYSQKIQMANLTLTMFDDNDYKEDTPTVGIKVANGANILNYTLDFTDEPNWNDIATSTIPLMDKEYYVLSVTTTANNTLTLLDSAVDALLAEGESTTVKVDGTPYTCSINFISSSSAVKLVINDETTNSLSIGETQKLSDGSYVGIKEVLYTSKDTGVSKVEFSIGKGKLKLTDGSDVEMNDDAISNLEANVSFSPTLLRSIGIIWKADDDLFITPDSEITMPGFESVKISFGGMVYADEEEIKVENDGSNGIVLKDFPLKDSVEDINILWTNATGGYNGTGKDIDNQMAVPGGSVLVPKPEADTIYSRLRELNQVWFDADVHDFFIATWNDTSSAESYMMRATGFKTESSIDKVTFEYRKDGVWTAAKSDAKNTTSFSLGNVELTVGYVSKANKTVMINATNTNTNFHTLYSAKGMRVYLPWINVTGAHGGNNGDAVAELATTCYTFAIANKSDLEHIGQIAMMWTNMNSTSNYTCDTVRPTYQLLLTEEDKDGNIGRGNTINLSLSATSTNAYTTVNAIAAGAITAKEQGDTDVFRSFAHSQLGTELLHDKSGDQYTLKLIYHGDEAYGEVYITSPETTILPGDSGEGGQVIVVKDSEVDSASGKNLFVVGGSCINTVAARILDSNTPLCTSAFTDKTGVAAGQYIIKTVASPYNADKVAMLVAGYNAADTVNAVAKAVEGVTSDVGTSQVYPIVAA